MVLCRFWQQGNCRYGDNCRFEHPGKSNGSQNPFSPLNGGGNSGGGGVAKTLEEKLSKYNLSLDAMEKDLTTERPTWILSAYGPGKNAPEQLFGGFPREQSPEEVRLGFYAAKASGNEQQALNSVQQTYQTAEQQMANARQNLKDALAFILAAEEKHPNRFDICEQGTQGQPFGVFDSSNNSAPNPFGAPNPSSSTTANPFGSNNNAASSPFGGSAQTTSAFGMPSALGQKPNPFGAPTPSAFGTKAPGTPFGGNSTAPAPFGQPAQSGASPFGQSTSNNNASPFGGPSATTTSAFGAPSVLGAKPSPFGAPSASPFGQSSQGGSQGLGFGQPSQLGQKPSPFGAPAATTPNAFGSNNQNKPNPFGAPSSNDSKPNPFGASSSNESKPNPFGAPSSSDNKPSPFGMGTSSNPNPFGGPDNNAKPNPFGTTNEKAPSPFATNNGGANGQNNQAPSPFGQPSQIKSPFASSTAPAANSFASQSRPNPFAPTPSQSNEGSKPNPFGESKPNPFGQPSQQAPKPNPFGPSQTTQQTAQPLAQNAAGVKATGNPYPPESGKQHPPLDQYTVKEMDGSLSSFKGKSVSYKDGKPGFKDFTGPWKRIWFPDGPPSYNKDTALKREEYDAQTLNQWKTFEQSGQFSDGVVPALPPPREACRWDM